MSVTPRKATTRVMLYSNMRYGPELYRSSTPSSPNHCHKHRSAIGTSVRHPPDPWIGRIQERQFHQNRILDSQLDSHRDQPESVILT